MDRGKVNYPTGTYTIKYVVQKPIVRNGKLPSARGGSTVVHADGKIIVFGGHYFEGNGQFKYVDETWLYDINNVAWHNITCSGDIPPPRYGHSAQIVGSRMFIFGGKGPNGAMYKDVFFLDLIEWIWVPVSTLSIGPSARMYHASQLVGRKIVIHGGWDGEDVYNDFWIFNTDSFAWMQPKTSGFAPSPRFGHSLTLTPDGRLIVFGGCSLARDTSQPKYHDDTRQLDTDTMIWTRPMVEGKCPTGRYGHTSLLLTDNKIAIFGGWGRGGCQTREAINNPNAHSLHILDTTSMTWQLPVNKAKRGVRHVYNHAACAVDSSLYIFGGYDGQQSVGDLYVVDVET
mmetsp:Transcript_18316/g.18394  ORF Transcript_18316/g.18394 Transcript_18316/m.18394 type:complete len:343 (+) Transcript_18316:96-1124(+)|eukprot:CAMPEP_0182418706 /NCGR_PEP_ID=MMETSP1167-20130531/3072_1 /TAXON_ID=2988 /ORGANISM="Mallomonas Sp, Strain CCMP3275" /LENGTH=342 /DNA_ID=CAMNT_0024593021 /DNA_START=20 /DNA_END=1048 /DNA_ORIENTATION=-